MKYDRVKDDVIGRWPGIKNHFTVIYRQCIITPNGGSYENTKLQEVYA